MAVGLIRTAWAGTSGGPGLTQMAIKEADGTFITSAGAQTAVNEVRTFWNAIAGLLPNEIILSVSPVIDFYNELNGDLISSITAATTPSLVQGSDTLGYSMASGGKLNLHTGAIRDGRRVRGTVYIVPLAGSAFTALGGLGSTPRSTIATAGNTLRTNLAAANLPLAVWSRERKATATLPQRNGAVTLVSTCETSEKGAVLRGRRD